MTESRDKFRQFLLSEGSFHDDLVYFVERNRLRRDRISVMRLDSARAKFDGLTDLRWTETLSLNVIAQIVWLLKFELINDQSQREIFSTQVFASPLRIHEKYFDQGSTQTNSYPNLFFQLHGTIPTTQLMAHESLKVQLESSDGIELISETVTCEELADAYGKEHGKLKNIMNHDKGDLEEVKIGVGDGDFFLKLRPASGTIANVSKRNLLHLPDHMFIFPEAISIHINHIISKIEK